MSPGGFPTSVRHGGKIDSGSLKEMLYIARKIMNEETDSVIIFKSKDERWLNKEVIGIERMTTDNFL